MSEEIKKSPSESQVIMTELVLPNDTNSLKNLFGGRLLEWMDIASGIAAQRHANQVCVTASVDNVSFTAPIREGDVVTLKAKVTRSFNSSMEICIDVTSENPRTQENIGSNTAFYTFVALDESGRKIRVPELIPESEEEKKFYKTALQRRELRLVMAGKLKLRDAHALKLVLNKIDDV